MDTTPKVSLDSLMSGLIDMAPPEDAPKKFKRVRGQPGQGQQTQTPTTTPTPTPVPAALSVSSTSSSPPTIVKSEPKQEPTKAPPKAKPSKQTPLAADMAAAAAAIFADPAPSSEPANVFTLTGSNAAPPAKKRKNKPKKKKAQPTEEATETQGSPKKQKKNHPEASQRPPRNNIVRSSRRANPQRIARNMDARPDLVGVTNEPEEDFSTLLLQHVEITNKELQKDLEEQSKKMMQEQKRQAALLTKQAAELSAPPPTQQNTEQKPREFIPRKPCVYYLKGTCYKKVCTFRHDPNDLPPEMRNAPPVQTQRVETAESKSKRGVCKFEKNGSCVKGESCLFSHNLKEEPCIHYHLSGICTNGVACRFGHDAITDEQRQKMIEATTKAREPRVDPENAEVMLQMAVPSHGTQGLSL
ncbi:hypothetical protein CPC16_001135 [Podila verticillata]|nr:hypothetical protein BGZ52_000857 [Haplosporangium bisporale]KAF9374678.1 hypothetical protein CPC16_001135 [Podila verticillata]KFH64683.1 hypothetical protein MVEG_09415 [Podila verticillata NRRL 6337]